MNLVTFFVIIGGAMALPVLGASTGEEVQPATWNSVEKLVSEQKMKKAVDQVAEIRIWASKAGDHDNWTRALIEEVQLRTALHGYETSVRFLMEQDWPDDPTSKTVLELFYANSLVTYSNAYSWEIRQRERVVSTEDVDLKQWTFAKIIDEANHAVN